MKKLLGILVLSLFLITPSQGDDIRDFQIEGMSIGDSALNYFSEERIKKKIKPTSFSNKKYTKVNISENSFETYEVVQFFFRADDKKYIIYFISGALFYENIKECYNKQEEIVAGVSYLFKNAKTDSTFEGHSSDKSGKTKTKATYFTFESGDKAKVACVDYSKELEEKWRWKDNLRVNIVSKEFSDWLINDAYN